MSNVTERAFRIKQLLDDEAVQEALRWMREAAYKAFLASTSDEDRRMAHAQAKVLDTFEQALRAIMDAGERETLEQEKRDRAPATREP